jgi:phage-related protein
MMAVTEVAYAGEKFTVEFFVAKNGEVLVQDWLNAQAISTRQKFAALFERLGDHGSIKNERKFKHLTGTDGIFEFKDDQGRVLCFFFKGRRVILTNGFTKKGAKTPKGEIERAERLKQDFEGRENS